MHGAHALWPGMAALARMRARHVVRRAHGGVQTRGTWLDVTGITVVTVVATDAIDGVRKAARSERNSPGVSNVGRT